MSWRNASFTFARRRLFCIVLNLEGIQRALFRLLSFRVPDTEKPPIQRVALSL